MILCNYYGINPAVWLTNQTADSASVNLALALLLGIPHINCENHLLANEVKLWLKSSTLPDDEIDERARVFGPGTACKFIHNIMNKLKTNKNRAVLCKETDLAPTIGNETRWASAGNMMNKYEKIETAVIEASMSKNADFSLPPITPSFNKSKEKTTGMLRDINYISVLMQTKLATLAHCQQIQAILIGKAENTSHWHQNTFGKTYIAHNSTKQPDKDFVSSVSKMQQRLGSTLTVDKKRAIDKWLPKPTPQAGPANHVSIADLVAQLPKTAAVVGNGKTGGGKRKAGEISEVSNNDDCFDHVIGSAAEVECLWSIARYILISTRSTLSPIIFEAILFLRANGTLWDVRTVQRALLAVRDDLKSERLKKKLAESADAEDVDGEESVIAVDVDGEESVI